MADSLSNNFASATNKDLENLAEDLGALLGGGSFRQGRLAAYPLGVDVGYHIPIVGIQRDNSVLRDDGDTARAEWSHLLVNLSGPRLNFVGRLGQMESADLWGAGLRYALPRFIRRVGSDVSVGVLYSELDHDFFRQWTMTVDVVATLNLPYIHPYIGAAFDRSELEATGEGIQRLGRKGKAKADGARLEAGINISVIPFTYVTLGAGIANDAETLHLGAGAYF